MALPNVVNSLLLAVVAISLPAPVWSAPQEEDLRDLATASCELPGLYVAPPSPWYSVPIDSEEDIVEGCQMLWEEGDQYMGIMRLVAFDLSERPEQAAEWERFAIGFEAMILERMNFTLGDVLWKRDSVPVSGEGFGNARAVGFEARLGGVTHQNEAHFLLFESATRKYVISIITPSESASPDIYRANTRAMGTVMQTLQVRP